MDTQFLIQTVSQIIPLSDKLLGRLADNLKEEKFPKKHLLLTEGQTARRIYFIQEGFARAYYYDKDKELTTWFMGKGDFMISVYSFFTQQPALENVELLEDCTLLSLSWHQLQALYEDFIEFNIVGRVLTEKYYMLSEERAILLRTMSAAERYHQLITKYPEILQQAKLGQIASYLGISQETLSRVRAAKFQ
jgi:CRP/FNR family transcriptional regulator, anaerobic regulatory protein